MRACLALAAAAALISNSAYADPAANPAPAKPAKKDDSQKIVCKTEDFVGSIIPRRICKTKADWEQGAYDAKDALSKANLRANPVDLAGRPGG